MLFTEDYYRDLISKLGIPEMPIKKVVRMKESKTKLETFYREFVKISTKVMQFVYYNNVGELYEAGFKHTDVMQMKRGVIPENVGVWIKTPPQYGGTLDFSNIFLFKKRPFDDIFNTFMDTQTLNFNKEHSGFTTEKGFLLPIELFVLNPPKIVFLPALKGIVSPGGATAADVMTVMGSTMFSKSGGF